MGFAFDISPLSFSLPSSFTSRLSPFSPLLSSFFSKRLAVKWEMFTFAAQLVSAPAASLPRGTDEDGNAVRFCDITRCCESFFRAAPREREPLVQHLAKRGGWKTGKAARAVRMKSEDLPLQASQGLPHGIMGQDMRRNSARGGARHETRVNTDSNTICLKTSSDSTWRPNANG